MKKTYHNLPRQLASLLYDIDNNCSLFHVMPKCNYKDSIAKEYIDFVYFWYKDNNLIQGYYAPSNYIDKVKKLYPYYNNSFPYPSIIMDKVNTYILISYLSNTITKTCFFPCAKQLNKKIKAQGFRIKRFIVKHIFLIPEMNKRFTAKQIMRHLTLNKGETQ